MIRTTWRLLTAEESARVRAIDRAIVGCEMPLVEALHVGAGRIDHTTSRADGQLVRVVVVFDAVDRPEDIAQALQMGRSEARAGGGRG